MTEKMLDKKNLTFLFFPTNYFLENGSKNINNFPESPMFSGLDSTRLT